MKEASFSWSKEGCTLSRYIITLFASPCMWHVIYIEHLFQCEHEGEAGPSGGSGGSGRSWQVFSHPGSPGRDGETQRPCLLEGMPSLPFLLHL